jgi:DegV family protein with EDD domain
MSARVQVVTDSTAGLSALEVLRHPVTVVPLQVVIGGIAYDDGATSSRAVAEALKSFTPVSTSRPAPQSFLDTYQEIAAAGSEAIVSIHLSGEMSGTVEAAMIAAKESSVPVRVIDSRSLGMGLGFPVLAAARAAAAGEDQAGVEAAARARMAAVSCFFYVDTLEHLRRGGRIGAAAALLGTALAVKPLLTVTAGQIRPLERVRTVSRARARLGELALAPLAQGATSGRVDVAVHHLDNADGAAGLVATLQEAVAGRGELVVAELGAVLGVHVGPGTLGVVVSPAG